LASKVKNEERAAIEDQKFHACPAEAQRDSFGTGDRPLDRQAEQGGADHSILAGVAPWSTIPHGGGKRGYWRTACSPGGRSGGKQKVKKGTSIPNYTSSRRVRGGGKGGG